MGFHAPFVLLRAPRENRGLNPAPKSPADRSSQGRQGTRQEVERMQARGGGGVLTDAAEMTETRREWTKDHTCQHVSSLN